MFTLCSDKDKEKSFSRSFSVSVNEFLDGECIKGTYIIKLSCSVQLCKQNRSIKCDVVTLTLHHMLTHDVTDKEMS